MLKPVDRAALSTRVFEQLRNEILDRQYQPGQYLPPERELCEILKVNRSSIREALKRLEQARLIEIRQGGGSIVLDFQTHAGLDLLGDLLVLGGKTNHLAIRSIFEFRALICPEIARLAATRIQKSELDTLRSLVEQIEACPEAEVKKLQQLDFEFLYTLAQASENLAHLFIINSTKEVYFAYQDVFAVMYQESTECRGLYRRIFEALRAHNPERSKKLFSELISYYDQKFFRQRPLVPNGEEELDKPDA